MITIQQGQRQKTSEPKYKWLMRRIQEQIEDGTLRDGDKLPPVRELAYQMSVTPGTVARAYKELVSLEVLEAGVGRGTFVRGLTRHAFQDDQENIMHLRSVRLPDVGQVDLIQNAFRDFADQAGVLELLSYPRRVDMRGLKQAYVNWFGGIPLGPYSVDDVVITHGGQHACVVVLQTILAERGGNVAVDTLTYTGFREAVLLTQSDVFPVEFDEEGPVPESFRNVVLKHNISVYFTCAEVNNPTTVTTTLARRHEIAQIADELNVVIIEDDCYRIQLTHQGSYRSILPHSAWYITSFSKSITPAVRVGCAVAPLGQAENLERTIFFNSLGVSTAICEVSRLILSHPRLPEIHRVMERELRVYVNETVKRLRDFDLKWQHAVPIFWLELPNGWRTSDFCREAEKRGILVTPSDVFTVKGQGAPSAVRFAVNAEFGLDRYCQAVDLLAEMLKNPPLTALV